MSMREKLLMGAYIAMHGCGGFLVHEQACCMCMMCFHVTCFFSPKSYLCSCAFATIRLGNIEASLNFATNCICASGQPVSPHLPTDPHIAHLDV